MNAVGTRAGAAVTLLFLFAGPIVWGTRFLLVYSFTALTCSRGWDPAIARAVILGSAVVALVLLGLVVMAGMRAAATPARHFVGWAAAAFAVLSGLAVVLEALPGLVVAICN